MNKCKRQKQNVSLNKKDSQLLTPNMSSPFLALSYSPKAESLGLGQSLWKQDSRPEGKLQLEEP